MSCVNMGLKVILILCTQLLVISEALRLGDPGVCSYNLGKMCYLRILLTLNLVILIVLCESKPIEDELYTSVTSSIKEFQCLEPVYGKNCKPFCIEPVCCDNYIYEQLNDTCIPQCKFGCDRGTCVAPDDCRCDPPLVLKDNTSCVEPTCDPPCVNANCDMHLKCNCFENYHSVNESYCETCATGETFDIETLKCKPICHKDCINGTCTGPETCTCNVGYKKKDQYNCVPDCNPSCQGHCIKPYTCSCLDGYKLIDGWKCNPVCSSCDNGDCIEPNTCKCHEGYSKKFGICTPDCDNCTNGVCSKPNDCKCNEGYSKKDNLCTPDCKNECTNGYCSEPDVCTCLPGYKPINDVCTPICNTSCVNSSCVQPNKCICLSGYEPTADPFTCKPKCGSCKNGECVAPGKCLCNNGYNMTNKVCSPICSKPCINGYCSSPEVCTCKNEYIKNNTDPSYCFKSCKIQCYNGKCDSDGNCVCNRGYKLKNDNCTAISPVDCNTGNCNGSCETGTCWCSDDRPCSFPPKSEPEKAIPLGLAGLQITWLVAAAVGLLLFTLVLVVLRKIWQKKERSLKQNVDKESENKFGGSVVYTVPNTLLHSESFLKKDETYEENDYDEVHLQEEEREGYHLMKKET